MQTPPEEPTAEPTEEALDRGSELGRAMAEGYQSMVGAICEAESEIADPAMVILSTWSRLIAELVWMGWSADELVKDVRFYAEDAAKIQAEVDEPDNDMGPASLAPALSMRHIGRRRG